MNIIDLITKTLTDQAIIGSIASTVFIILLGYTFRKLGIFNNQVGKLLSTVVLTAALPALAFSSFMQDINQQDLITGMSLLIWGFVIYILLIFITKPMFLMYQGNKQDTLRVLTIFGSTTFFSTPIISAMFGPIGVMLSSIFNIAYRIFLYSYGFIKMSGLKMSKENVKTMFFNPIVLATFAGLFVWLFQASLPQVSISATDGSVRNFAFLRIDQTAIWLYRPMEYLADICSPLAWLSIGATLGQLSLKDALSDKTVWYYSFCKVLIVPAINVVALLVLNALGILSLSYIAFAVVIIMMMAPPATIAAAYAISFNKEAVLASNASLVSTIVAVVAIPFWIVILGLIQHLGWF